MEGGIFLTVKDLSKLLDVSYRAANTEHIHLRDVLKKRNKRISIKEYCDFEGLDFDYIMKILRGKQFDVS